jgi:hypothetical protein
MVVQNLARVQRRRSVRLAAQQPRRVLLSRRWSLKEFDFFSPSQTWYRIQNFSLISIVFFLCSFIS